MYFHYIAIFDYNGNTYAYHISSSDPQERNSKVQVFLDLLADKPLTFGIHQLATGDSSFKSIQTMDPYFNGMIVIDDVHEFINLYNSYLSEKNTNTSVNNN